MFLTALFITAKTGNNVKMFFKGSQTDKLWYILTEEYHSLIKRETSHQATRHRGNTKRILLSKRRQLKMATCVYDSNYINIQGKDKTTETV